MSKMIMARKQNIFVAMMMESEMSHWDSRDVRRLKENLENYIKFDKPLGSCFLDSRVDVLINKLERGLYKVQIKSIRRESFEFDCKFSELYDMILKKYNSFKY